MKNMQSAFLRLAYFSICAIIINVSGKQKLPSSIIFKGGVKRMTEEIITTAEDKEDVISGNTLKRLIEYMRSVAKWSDSQIVDLIEAICE